MVSVPQQNLSILPHVLENSHHETLKLELKDINLNDFEFSFILIYW